MGQWFVSITVPAAFANRLIAAEGVAPKAWLAALPALAERYLTRWRLTLDHGDAMHGRCALVLPVRTARDRVAPLAGQGRGAGAGRRRPGIRAATGTS